MSSFSIPEKYTPMSNTSMTRDVTTFVGIVVTGVLDAQLLQRKAVELITRWPALGGKIITKVPYSFTTGSIVDFKSRNLDSSLHEIFPIDINIKGVAQKPSCRVYKNGGPRDTLFHFDSMRAFNRLNDTLFALRVTVLKDATLLGFRVAHHFCDGEGLYDIIKAYCDIISDRPIPDLILPPDTKVPLSSLVQGKDSLPESVAEDIRLPHPSKNFAFGFLSLLLVIGYIFLKLFAGWLGILPSSEWKYIHLPKGLVEGWRDECQKELDEDASKGSLREGAGVELTKNDVITAWFLKTAFLHVPPDNLPIDLNFAYNYRPVLQSPPSSTYYIHNSFLPCRTHWPSLSSLQASSLAQISLDVRLSVIRHKQPSVVREALEFWEANPTTLATLGGPGVRWDFWPFLTTWTRFEYNGMDFSAALVPAEKSRGDVTAGKVIFTQPYAAFPAAVRLDPYAFLVKDGQGGYWLNACLGKASWKGHGV